MIQLGNQNFDATVEALMNEGSEGVISKTEEISLKTSAISSVSSYFNKDNDGFKFKTKSNTVTARKVIALLKSSNPDIEIQYSDDLEDNNLINKSDKPLWVLNKNQNGVFQLKKAV